MINHSNIALNKSINKVKRSPVEIDNIIKHRIEQLTSENSNIWSSPDHNRRDYIHGFFQYPAMMVPIVQKRIIDIIKSANADIKNIIDPFMGSATSLVTCMELGLDCYGQDINPLAVLIGLTRTGPYYYDAIKIKSDKLLIDINGDNNEKIEANFNGLNKWFKKDVIVELSKIVRAIKCEPLISIRRFYWVVLAETIRLTSNDRTSTFKLHAKPIEDIEIWNPSPIKEFKKHLYNSLDDLKLYKDLLNKNNQLIKGRYKGNINIALQDSSKKILTPNDKSDFFDLLVTSPPYGDNKTTVTYGQHSYLPLQWIELADINSLANKDFLRTTMEIDSRSLGGRLRKLSENQISMMIEKSPTFKSTYIKLLTTTNEKVNKVLAFINDLYNVIKEIFRVMKPNSYQVWTIGNRTVGGVIIPNNQIIKEFVTNFGGLLVTEVEREILNKRMAKRNNDSALMNFEDILIFRKLG